MTTLIDDSLLDALEQQVSSGCINKELFQAQIDLIRTLCANYDETVADLQAQITLCCGNTAAGGDAEFEANGTDLITNDQTSTITVISLTDGQLAGSGLTTCAVRVGGTVDICTTVNRPNDEDFPQVFSMQREIQLLCDGVVVDTQTVTVNPVTTQGGTFTLCATGSFVLTDDLTNGNGCVYSIRAVGAVGTNSSATVDLSHNFSAQCS